MRTTSNTGFGPHPPIALPDLLRQLTLRSPSIALTTVCTAISFLIFAFQTGIASAQDNTVNPVSAPVRPGLDMVVTPFASVPYNSSGLTARINSMATSRKRIFVAESLEGRIWDITDGSPIEWFNVEAALINTLGHGLDISNRVHGGLRSLSFHPEFHLNGKFYTSLMLPRGPARSDTPYLSEPENPIEADSVLSEWTVNTQGPVASYRYREVFRVGMPVYDHPIKQITFNPYSTRGASDYGLLYIGHGDGSVGSSTAGGGQGNDALGKIIRINPLRTGDSSFTIPLDNPFAGDSSMIDSVYATGLRNPHHLAFSPQGHLLIADAGRDNVEEVNLITGGANYGWPKREGTFVHLTRGGLLTGIRSLPVNDSALQYTYPVAQFGHSGQRGDAPTSHAIAGGQVISNQSSLEGHYFYGEFTRQGDIYHSRMRDLLRARTRGKPADLTQATTYRARILFDHDGNDTTPYLVRSSMLDVIQESLEYDGSDRADLRFGKGPLGGMFIMSKRNNTVYRVNNKSRNSLKQSSRRTIGSLKRLVAGLRADELKSTASRARLLKAISNLNRLVVFNTAATNLRLQRAVNAMLRLNDGCGDAPDSNDLVISCDKQATIREQFRFLMLKTRQMQIILRQ